MILGIITTIGGLAGIYGFFSGIYMLTYIGFALVVMEVIIGLVSGSLNGIFTEVIAVIVGLALCFFKGIPLLLSISICLCFETVILFIAGIPMMIVALKSKDN